MAPFLKQDPFPWKTRHSSRLCRGRLSACIRTSEFVPLPDWNLGLQIAKDGIAAAVPPGKSAYLPDLSLSKFYKLILFRQPTYQLFHIPSWILTLHCYFTQMLRLCSYPSCSKNFLAATLSKPNTAVHRLSRNLLVCLCACVFACSFACSFAAT